MRGARDRAGPSGLMRWTWIGRWRRRLQWLAEVHGVAIGGHVDRDVALDVELGVPHVDPMRARRELDRAGRLVAGAVAVGREVGPRRQVDPDTTRGGLASIATVVRGRDGAPAAVVSRAGGGVPAARAGDVRLSRVWLPGIPWSGSWLACGWPAGGWLAGSWLAGSWLACGWLAGSWLACGCGSWLACGWLAGGWLAGSWLAGSWLAGSWLAGAGLYSAGLSGARTFPIPVVVRDEEHDRAHRDTDEQDARQRRDLP
jgi:hypothetical protein